MHAPWASACCFILFTFSVFIYHHTMSIDTRIDAIAAALTGMPSYCKIKSKAKELLTVENQTLAGLESSLRQDAQLADAWEQVRQALMANKSLWDKICRSWHSQLTRSVIPPNVFPHGGNRHRKPMSSNIKSHTLESPMFNKRIYKRSRANSTAAPKEKAIVVPVKVEPSTRLPWVCTACDAGGLVSKLTNGTPPHSDMAAKRKHRAMVLDQ